MQSLVRSLVVLPLCLGLAIWMGGCPSGGTQTSDTTTTTTTTTTTGTTSSTLTDAEEDAVADATRSAESLAQAVNTTQSPTGAEEEENQATLDIPTGTQTLTFGLCPQVDMTATNDGLLTFDMTVDFGTGCHPLGSTEYTCSGQASGSFDQRQKTMTMDFENISCEEATLRGDVDVVYERSATAVDVDGTWDLTYTDSAGSIATNGTGDGSYDLSDYSTTITSFTGTITDGTYTYNAVVANLAMSFPTYGVFMPYAGQITLSGTGIRTMVIQFDANSPTTGVVQVSVGAGPAVPVAVYAY